MDEQPQRPRFIEPAAAAQTPEVARQVRATRMIGGGVLALLVAFLGLADGGGAIGLLFGVLGVGLLVGGLVIRR